MEQQEKEALDDLATELELADEDEPVLYAVLLAIFLDLIYCEDIKSERRFFICLIPRH